MAYHTAAPGLVSAGRVLVPLATTGAGCAGKRALCMAVILGVALAITSLLLPLSVYPGLFSELTFLAAISSPFWMPAACLSCWTFADMAHEVCDRLRPPPGRRRWLATAALLLIVNCGLLWSGVPRRLAFLHARSAFEASVTAAPPAYSQGATINWRLGVYRVDRLCTDPRGGIYFRTRFGPDGFHMGKMAYGFSHRPNQTGSPFGDEKYTLSHIVGDWYAFQAAER